MAGFPLARERERESLSCKVTCNLKLSSLDRSGGIHTEPFDSTHHSAVTPTVHIAKGPAGRLASYGYIDNIRSFKMYYLLSIYYLLIIRFHLVDAFVLPTSSLMHLPNGKFGEHSIAPPVNATPLAGVSDPRAKTGGNAPPVLRAAAVAAAVRRSFSRP
jgi:hypothetical protein